MSNITSFFLLFFLIILCVVFVSAQPQQQCLDEGSFKPNSTFDNNRHLLLSSLPSNLTPQNSFFFNTSLGQEPDRVYALATCIPSTETDDCSICVKNTSDGLIKNCPNNTEAFHWSSGENTLCFVRYSNHSFFGTVDMDPRQILPNVTNIRSDSMPEFDGVWQDLMLSMVESVSSKNYEARIRPFKDSKDTTTTTIYTIMMCTNGLTKGDCNTCLRNSVGDFQNCCRGRQGGLVTRPNCFFRWEFYPFYRAFRNISPPAKKDSPLVKILASTLVIGLLAFVVGCVLRRRWKNKEDGSRETFQEIDTAEVNALSSLKFEFRIVQEATNDFSEENKLGEGGFGPVYKGKLQNGQEIAVKRLAISSGQGDEEFKNEVMLLSKLQHRNLVKLLGFCLKGDERLLIYEYVPNSSLDHFIFEDEDSSESEHPLSLKADWRTRYNIIENIARGILYLHEDSRLKIIHRDLKPSNILLDYQMNPKISDFGMARLFDPDEQTQGLTTSRVMGTYGYMAPEYIAQGRFSVKTDVYSYGVMVLEIICGQKNSSFQPSGVAFHAWMNWREKRVLDIVDPSVTKNVSRSEMMKCINIGLLCVQESVTRRPTMNSVLYWLNSDSVTLPVPSTPAFVVHGGDSGEASRVSQVNVSITELEPR